MENIENKILNFEEFNLIEANLDEAGNIVKSFAERVNKSEEEVEKLWEEAKVIVKKEYPDIKEKSGRYYRLVAGIVKTMLKLK